MIILVRPDDKLAAPLLQHCLLLLPLQRNAMLPRNAMHGLQQAGVAR